MHSVKLVCLNLYLDTLIPRPRVGEQIQMSPDCRITVQNIVLTPRDPQLIAHVSNPNLSNYELYELGWRTLS